MCTINKPVIEFVYIWEYSVTPGSERDFEDMYGRQGDWARFFSRSPDYVGTRLLRDRQSPGRYLTVDRWTSRESQVAFVSEHRQEFDFLDIRGDRLTESEQRIGDFEETGA